MLFRSSRPEARHVRIVECLLAMNRAGHVATVSECIRMCRDVGANGQDSPYVKKLAYLPGVWELKPNVRGGLRGSARVYFFWLSTGQPLLVNAEYRQQEQPADLRLLGKVVEVTEAIRTAQGRGKQ